MLKIKPQQETQLELEEICLDFAEIKPTIKKQYKELYDDRMHKMEYKSNEYFLRDDIKHTIAHEYAIEQITLEYMKK